MRKFGGAFLLLAAGASLAAAAPGQPTPHSLPPPQIEATQTPARCDWTRVSISSGGGHIAGFGAAASLAIGRYRPLDVELCKIDWRGGSISACLTISGLRRPVEVFFDGDHFNVVYQDGSRMTIDTTDGASSFIPAHASPHVHRAPEREFEPDNMPFDAGPPIHLMVQSDGSIWQYDRLKLGELIGQTAQGEDVSTERAVFRYDAYNLPEVMAVHTGAGPRDTFVRLSEESGAAIDWIERTSERSRGMFTSGAVSAAGEFAALVTTSPELNEIIASDLTRGSSLGAVCEAPNGFAQRFTVDLINLGTADRPLRAIEISPDSPVGVIAVFNGGPRGSALEVDAQGWLHPFLQAGYAVLAVEYSGSRSSILSVNSRLQSDGVAALTEDWRHVNAHLASRTPCRDNLLAGVSFGAVFFQIASGDETACVGGALLAAPWLKYREPEDLFGSRLFGNTSRDSSIRWESQAIGESLHDPRGEFRRLQDVNLEQCRFSGTIYGIFPARDAIGVPEDLDACLEREGIEIVTRAAPYDYHDLIFTDPDEIYGRAARFFSGKR